MDARLDVDVMLTQYKNGVMTDPQTMLSCWCCKSHLDRFVNEASAVATEPKSADPSVYFHKLLYREVQFSEGFARARRLIKIPYGQESHLTARAIAEKAVEILGGYAPVCCMLPESWWSEAIESYSKVHGKRKS